MTRLLLLLPACLALAALPGDVAPSDAGLAPGAEEEQGREPEPGIVTLWARDDLRSSFDFRTGGPGARVEAGEIVLDDAHMVFDVFAADMLSFGYQRDELVNIIDLGEVYVHERERARDRAPKFAISLFHTLFLDGAHFAYLEPGGRAFRLEHANRIFAAPASDGLYHVRPEVGHTYLVRTRRRGLSAADQFAKFQVVDHEPGRSLTIRWAPVPVN